MRYRKAFAGVNAGVAHFWFAESEGTSRMTAAHIHFFFTLRDQIKLYHWQTTSYARHKATDDVIKDLDEHIDSFVEIYAGKYGRSRVGTATNTVTVKNLGDAAAVRFVKECIAYLAGPLTKSLGPRDTDLTNIRDEMIGNLNQLLYLFTLK
jgi:hypothetical protein